MVFFVDSLQNLLLWRFVTKKLTSIIQTCNVINFAAGIF